MIAFLAQRDSWELIGWAGQGFYFLRFLIQWLASEKAKGIVVPTIFWWMSLAGSVCTTAYTYVDGNLFFMAGPCINFFIFVRNLWLARTGRPLHGRILLPFFLGLVAIAVAVALGRFDFGQPLLWIIVGSCGTFLWSIRFPLQWWLSERRAEASLPPAFFWVSFVGSVLLLMFSLRTGNPIYIAGMVLGPFLYGRSLVLTYRPQPAPNL